jgi:hypothetical protein
MYSYSFGPELQQEWYRSERFAAQPEIRAYLDHVADRYDLRRDIQLNTRVVSAHYDQTRKRWRVSTAAGHWRPNRWLSWSSYGACGRVSLRSPDWWLDVGIEATVLFGPHPRTHPRYVGETRLVTPD